MLFSGVSVDSTCSEGPSELHPIFTVSIDGFPIDHEKAKGAVACVQDLVGHPLFTQRNFFFETEIGMLNTAVSVANAFRHRSEFDPWRTIGVEAGPMMVDLKSCREKVALRIKTVKDTRERCFGAQTVASSTACEAAPRTTTVCISRVVEVGDV